MNQLLICFFSITLVSSCMGSKKELDSSVESYNNALRWGDLTAAMSFVSAEKRSTYFRNAQRMMKSLRVTDFRIDHVEDLGDSKGKRIFITIAMINESTATENQLLTEQRWSYNSNERQWEIAADRPFEVAEKMP